MRLLSKRPRPYLAIVAGLALLVVLGLLVVCHGPRSAPRPSSPVILATTSPSASPTLRPPQVITTPPPTATPLGGGEGMGKG